MITYDEYVDMLKKKGAVVDTTTLIKSRRCPDKICLFISNKLGMKMEADNDHEGTVRFLEDNYILLKKGILIKLSRNI